MALINLFIGTTVRNDLFVELWYAAWHKLIQTTWPPLSIRKFLAGYIFALGGVHSASGVWVTVWLIDYVQAQFYNDHENGFKSYGNKAVAIMVLIFTGIMVLTSVPWFRRNYHNVWELVHRYAGWVSLGLLWALFDLNVKDANEELEKYGLKDKHIYDDVVPFVLLVLSTFNVALPWLFVYKVNVKAFKDATGGNR